jgi:transcriptional regulator with XRE-family HTH domain
MSTKITLPLVFVVSLRIETLMFNRIKELRKALKLNQSEFAERLKLTQTSLSMIELGKNALTDKNIKLICMIFNVNEHWLRTGAGEMFDSPSPREQEFLAIFRDLMPANQEYIVDSIKRLLETQEKLLKRE